MGVRGEPWLWASSASTSISSCAGELRADCEGGVGAAEPGIGSSEGMPTTDGSETGTFIRSSIMIDLGAGSGQRTWTFST